MPRRHETQRNYAAALQYCISHYRHSTTLNNAQPLRYDTSQNYMLHYRH